MKIVLDQVQPDKDRYVAYVQLQDDSGRVIDTASVPYSGDTEDLKAAVVSRFEAALSKEAARKQVEDEVRAALATIDVAKELAARERHVTDI